MTHIELQKLLEELQMLQKYVESAKEMINIGAYGLTLENIQNIENSLTNIIQMLILDKLNTNFGDIIDVDNKV